MRALLALIALAFGGAQSHAQTPATPAPAARSDSTLAQQVAAARTTTNQRIPDADRFTVGDRSIAKGTTVDGPVAVARGNLDVYGLVQGDVVALDGDVRVHRGGRVTGDAWSAGGSVIIDGGVVEGTKRAISTHLPASFTSAPSRPLTTLETIKLTIGWFALLAIIGLGVMVFAEGNLDGVVMGMERSFAKAFWAGLGVQVVLLPGLLLLVAALAITVIGVLLIPFAVVVYVIAAAGLVTLGFLGAARLTGVAFTSDRGTTSPRGVHLRALIMGLFAYLAIWLLAAVFTWSPVTASVIRMVAIAITWVAATVGLGAAITSRAGTVRPGTGVPATTDEFAWQTPTPVTGVAAATRRVASSR
jgi:hypothetical protein